MKKQLSLLFIMLLAVCFSQAQLVVNTGSETASKNPMTPLAQSFTVFIKAIKPASMTASFTKQKEAFYNDASRIAAPADLARNLSKLASYIKPAKLKTEFKKADFVKATSHTTTLEGVKGFLKDLENNLKSGTMNDIWKIQRNGWLADLSKI